jgi:hypothetical protein
MRFALPYKGSTFPGWPGACKTANRTQGVTELPDYLSERQNALSQNAGEKAVLNTYLETIASEFGLTWLESDGGNPVQKLWRSQDAMATNELLNLGRAVQNLLQADTRWTRRQIGRVKSSDQGQRAGAIFEILGLELFNRPGQQVHPAGDDQKATMAGSFSPTDRSSYRSRTTDYRATRPPSSSGPTKSTGSSWIA